MKSLLAAACLLILACAVPSAAQSDDKGKSGSLPPELQGAFKPVTLSADKNAWALQIVTRGGLTGTGRGDVTVTSWDSRVVCGPQGADCLVKQPNADIASRFATLSRRVAAAKPSKWKALAGTTCADCYLTLLVLQRREGGGREKTYTLYWDDATAAAVPADVKEILRAVAALTLVPARVL